MAGIRPGQIQAWIEAPGNPPLIALHFAPGTGATSRTTDAENPELRSLMPVLLQTDTPEALDAAIVNVLERLRASKQTPSAGSGQPPDQK